MTDRTKTVLTAMRRILRVTEDNAKALMRQTGLSTSQLILLQLLEDGGEMTAGEIAHRMGITQATTTALLHKLQARGFVVRRRGETDRRQVWLTLSEAGHDILAIAPDGVHARFHDSFTQLKDWEQASIMAALERVADMLGAAEMDAAPIIDSEVLVRDPAPRAPTPEPVVTEPQ